MKLPALLLALAGLGALSLPDLNASLPPGGNFDLSHWYLQLPTSNGVLTGASGSVDSASTAQLVGGFTNAYFYTGPDGAMTFWAPDDGAHTSGSAHPRSELREELSPGDTSVNWLPFGNHILAATCVVSNVPADAKKVCLAQIHEDAGAGVPMTMIMFYNNTIYADYWPDGNANNSSSWQYGSAAIGSTINYQIQVLNGVLSVAVNGLTNSLDLFNAGTNWTLAANTVYFKAGDYSQTSDTCSCSNDGAKVAFYALTRYHAPSITNQPTSVAVKAGTNALFAAGASGNGSLSYQWWFNATNLLASATNATLIVSNVSAVNAGNYTVVVGDSTSSFSSVTSGVATLTAIYPSTNVVFASPGPATWICPTGVTSVQVECWGGGGAGGSALRVSTGNAFGGGGAGGCYARKNAVPVTPGSSYALTVGAGGVSLTNDLATVAGGDSTFTGDGGVITLAKGGGGGQSRTNLTTSGVAGAGGGSNVAACVGDVIFAGGAGAAGKTSPSSYGGGGGGGAGDNAVGSDASSVTNAAGPGGIGLLTAGGNGGAGRAASSGYGSSGSAPGGGGGGARGSNTTQQWGGNGAAGEVIVTYAVGSCAAAVAVMPMGNGGGTNGLVVCSGQSATLTEIPAAGVGPFTFAWKKVGSPAVLGTSSNLLVSAIVNGDQYTCDVASACGGNVSTSPAATLVVAAPGVTLSATNQVVYHTMSVNLTATLSGSATGGVWTTSGAGSFSSSNALNAIYAPGVADAGTLVNLTFTTLPNNACSPAVATDTVTFSLAANPDRIVLLKADDFRGQLTYGQQWTNFLLATRALGVKAGIGVICTNLVGSGSNLIAQWMQAQEALGDVQFWDHAWDHTEWTNAGGQLVSEYEGSGLAYMQQHLAQSQAALSNALGHAAIAFGTAYNGFDTNTAAVINATPALRLFFASSVPTVRSAGLNAKVAAVKIISESDGTGLPDSTNFIAAYPGGPMGPVALQFHPPYFVNANGTNSLLEFQKIIQYLQTNGYSFLLPAEYVATLPAIVTQPAGQFALSGSNASFVAAATGDPTLAYQWQFNGTNCPGANAATLTVTNVQPANTGAYTVIVTNLSGVVTSAVAPLAIKSPPSIAGAVVSNQTFQLGFTGSPGASYLVQTKTNLAGAVWLSVSTNVTDSNGFYLFLDAGLTNAPNRFYRLVAP